MNVIKDIEQRGRIKVDHVQALTYLAGSLLYCREWYNAVNEICNNVICGWVEEDS